VTPDELQEIRRAMGEREPPECPVCGRPLEIWLQRVMDEEYVWRQDVGAFEREPGPQHRIVSPCCGLCGNEDEDFGALLSGAEERVRSGGDDA